jgi:hypothetical protein
VTIASAASNSRRTSEPRARREKPVSGRSASDRASTDALRRHHDQPQTHESNGTEFHRIESARRDSTNAYIYGTSTAPIEQVNSDLQKPAEHWPGRHASFAFTTATRPPVVSGQRDPVPANGLAQTMQAGSGESVVTRPAQDHWRAYESTLEGVALCLRLSPSGLRLR